MYKTPPRYGSELADNSRDIMQIATVVHMCFALYMFSNSSIFTTTSDIGISLGSMSFGGSDDGILSPTRLSQPHVVLYLVWFMMILGVFIITRIINTFFPNFWSKLACIVKIFEHHIEKLKAQKIIVEFEPAYADNIFREMIVDDLRREFEKTEIEYNDLKTLFDAGQIKREPKAVEHMLKKVESKITSIKELINRWLRQAQITKVEGPSDAFHKLFKFRKSDPSHRLKTLYSYDIKDNELFKKTQKVEEKLRKRYAK
jgi:hypothetical protein